VALAEIHRVLRPTGRLYLLEHVRSQDPAVVRRQDRLTPAARWLSGDHFNRDTLGAVAAAGFGIGQVERLTLPGRLGAVQPLVVAVAEPERR
jgi:SAM-dependent methyltransferase